MPNEVKQQVLFDFGEHQSVKYFGENLEIHFL